MNTTQTNATADRIIAAAADFQNIDITTGTEATLRGIWNQAAEITAHAMFNDMPEAADAMREVKQAVRDELARRGIAFRR